ncbi:MAG: hypothetical protein WBQ79_03045 [Acidobacteriaceae bacterium]
MRLNRRLLIACYSSLILMSFAGCCHKIIRQKAVEIEVDSNLGPISPAPPPGKTVEWVAADGASFAVSWQAGLCEKNTPNPIPATDGKAKCTIASQTFTKQQPFFDYTYCIKGQRRDNNPRDCPKFMMRVGPGGCPHC